MVVKTKSSGVTMLSFSYLGKSCTEKGKLLVLGENNGEEKMKNNFVFVAALKCKLLDVKTSFMVIILAIK